MTSVRLLNECQSSDFCLPAWIPISASLLTFLQHADCLSAYRPVCVPPCKIRSCQSAEESCVCWLLFWVAIIPPRKSCQPADLCLSVTINLLTNICQPADRYFLWISAPWLLAVSLQTDVCQWLISLLTNSCQSADWCLSVAVSLLTDACQWLSTFWRIAVRPLTDVCQWLSAAWRTAVSLLTDVCQLLSACWLRSFCDYQPSEE